MRLEKVVYPADSSGSQAPLDLEVRPLTKTSLLLDWTDPFMIGNTTFTVSVTVGLQQVMEEMLMETSVAVGLEGSECQPFHVSVSVPGNCPPATFNGSFLVGEQ